MQYTTPKTSTTTEQYMVFMHQFMVESQTACLKSAQKLFHSMTIAPKAQPPILNLEEPEPVEPKLSEPELPVDEEFVNIDTNQSHRVLLESFSALTV